MSTVPTPQPTGVVVMSTSDFQAYVENLLERQYASFTDVVTAHLPKPAPQKTLLTRKEACERLQITFPTLDRRLKDGSLPFKKIGRRILVDVSAIAN